MSTPAHDDRRPVVALDLGNVCVQLTPDRFAHGFGYESFVSMMTHGRAAHEVAIAYETGRIDTAAFLTGMRASVRKHLADDSALLHAWNGILGAEMPGMAGVVDAILARGCRPVFLSDICPLHLALLRHLLSFAPRVPDAVVSFEVGALKPHASMYLAMEQRFCHGGLPILYADDKLENVLAARARGWNAYHFGTATGLMAELDKVAPPPAVS